MIERTDITGVVFAGGQGRRMGGVDKGLVALAGRPLVAQVIERLAPQVGGLVINANQNRDRYAAFGYPVVADVVPDFAGPLAGLHAALAFAATPYVVIGSGVRRSKIVLPGAALADLPGAEVLAELGRPVPVS